MKKNNTWIVDDIQPVPFHSGFWGGSNKRYWVSLINATYAVDAQVRHILTDEEMILATDDYNLSDRTKDNELHFAQGNAYDIEWDKLNLKRDYFSLAPEGDYYADISDWEEMMHLVRNHQIEERIDSKFRAIHEESDNVRQLKHSSDEIEFPMEFLNNLGLKCQPLFLMKVFNVGQGDTIMLIFPDMSIWLVDAFFEKHREKHQMSYDDLVDLIDEKYSDFRVERVVISHLHRDHCLSVNQLARDIGAESIIYTFPNTKLTKTALGALSNTRILRKIDDIESVQKGSTKITLTPACKLQYKKLNDYNANGIIVELETNNSHVLLSGDSPWKQLEEVVSNKNMSGKHKYYKVSHHGSITGYDHYFINGYAPDLAVISFGIPNRYGHPDRRVLCGLFQSGAFLSGTAILRKKYLPIPIF